MHESNLARKVGGAAGMVAGSLAGMAAALPGTAKTPSLSNDLFLAPALSGNQVVGLIGEAMVGAVRGALMGAQLGLSLGSLIDKHILANLRCLECGRTFTESKASAHDGDWDDDLDPEMVQ